MAYPRQEHSQLPSQYNTDYSCMFKLQSYFPANFLVAEVVTHAHLVVCELLYSKWHFILALTF